MPWRGSGESAAVLTVLRTEESGALRAVAEAGGLSHWGFLWHLTCNCPTELHPTQLLGFTCSHKCKKTHTHTHGPLVGEKNNCQLLALLHFPAVCNFETWHGWVTSATQLVINLTLGLSWKCYSAPLLLLDNKLKSQRYPSLFKH